MTEYEIRKYDESYIEDQVKIGMMLAERTFTYRQSSVEQVKQVYSREDFDPETRLYCFKGDELVGYIGARVSEVEEEKIKVAQTRLAFYLPGHDKAYDLLYDHLVEVLKNKDVKRIETGQTVAEGHYYELAKKKGFQLVRDGVNIYQFEFSNLKDFATDSEAGDFNKETESEQVIKMLGELYTEIPAENIQNALNNYAENENVVANRVLLKDGKVVAYGCATKGQHPEFVNIRLLCSDNSEHKKHITTELVKKCKENGFEKVNVFLNPENPVDAQEGKDIETIGFEKIGSFETLSKEI
ncbi:MAG: GNAT family N-acetyltransferase [Candidatus Heimdallarchaeota archaeon]|nr:GNAT family N-acetyltransferase [Candidatus Heimdallarchaeota archaeon]MCK4878548.1 GNAT family N-acetyltransferase [Candidatus Heimdallarchaeota archaeon]